jgi:NACHT domain
MSSIVASIAFANLLINCFDKAKGEVGIELDKWKNKKEALKLHRSIASYRMVKTIWDPEHAVDLRKFYCPPSISTTGNKRKIVNTINDLPPQKNVVIQGIAGQGKTILIRHLCSVELELAHRIPIFIELRKITKVKNLDSRIEESFTELGLKYHKRAFEALYADGKLCLLLDGFDEVDEAVKAELIWEIESLSKKFPQLRIIITARPESEICSSSFFDIVHLSGLKDDEHERVIQKLLGDDPLCEHLLQSIKTHKNGVNRLLTTPLLVTLLTITYKTFEKIPDQLSEFYDSIFNTLVWRHDKLKPGYRRPRKSSMSDSDFRKVFESFCFYIKEYSKASYNEKTVRVAAEKAIKTTGVEVKPDIFIADLVSITCLLVRDSAEYRFIHRSIQEFFAASYISERPSKTVEGFFSQLKTKGSSGFLVAERQGQKRSEIEFTAKEEDASAIIGEASEAASGRFQGLDARVEALGDGVGDGVIEVVEQTA